MTEKKKGNQLHQVLAVENEKKSTSASILAETLKTFKDKQSHFDGETRKYNKILDDSDTLVDEHKEVYTTVKAKLEYTLGHLGESIDLLIQKEETNASGVAVAELIVDGEVFGTFAATTLLQLETQLKSLRSLYNVLPTLDPVKKWTFNKQKELYETESEVSYRSIKKPEVIILHPATDKHPAQTQLITKDVQAGSWEKSFASGRITPLQKSYLLGNIDELINAVKKARSIANNAEVKNVKISKKLFEYINKPLKT
ncbi:MAG: DUF7873 family protein [Candidatus Hodarchaeales archaeon]|jgi:hypothetical protein